MRLDRALVIEQERHDKKMRIREKKGHDYANVDCLSNFKCRSEIYAVLEKYGMPLPIETAKGAALNEVFLKLLRLLNLWADNKTALNESEDDTWLDASNYLDLAYECRLDELLYQKEKDELLS